MAQAQLTIQPLRYRRRQRRITPLRAAFFVLIILVVAVMGVSGYVAWSLTHPAKKELEAAPDQLGLAYENVEFQSKDGTLLRGWYLPAATNERVVVMAHGYRQNRMGDKPALPTAQKLVEAGFGVLMFDFRASGQSDGDMVTVGLLEQEDLQAAIRYVQGKGYASQGLGLQGFSMGAATSLLAAAGNQDVQAVVADSPFSDLEPYLHENMPHWTHLPDIPFTPVILWELPLLMGHSPSEVSPIAGLEKLRDRPVLFIHGGNDQAISSEHSRKMLAKLQDGGRAELWSVAEAGHVATWEVQPDAYTKRVVEFFLAHLGR